MESDNKDAAEDSGGGPAGSPGAGHADGSDGRPAPREIGGRDGPDPTRYGDWEKAGRCIDF